MVVSRRMTMTNLCCASNRPSVSDPLPPFAEPHAIHGPVQTGHHRNELHIRAHSCPRGWLSATIVSAIRKAFGKSGQVSHLDYLTMRIRLRRNCGVCDLSFKSIAPGNESTRNPRDQRNPGPANGNRNPLRRFHNQPRQPRQARASHHPKHLMPLQAQLPIFPLKHQH